MKKKLLSALMSAVMPELTVLPYDLRRADERRQELFDAWQALCGEVEA